MMKTTLNASNIDVQCPQCQSIFLAPSRILGGLGRCSKCHHEFIVTSQNTRPPQANAEKDKLEWTQCTFCNAPFPIRLEEFGLVIGCRNCGETFHAQRWDPSATRRMKAIKKARTWDELKDHVRKQRKSGKPLQRVESELVASGVFPETAQNVVNAVLTEDSHLMLKAVQKAQISWWESGAPLGLLQMLMGAVLYFYVSTKATPDAVENTKMLGIGLELFGIFSLCYFTSIYRGRLRPVSGPNHLPLKTADIAA